MLRSLLLMLAMLAPPAMPGASSDYRMAADKFSLIEHERLRPGTRVDLTARELNAYVLQKLPEAVPDGVRNPHLELGSGRATGSALIDFAKVRRAQGKSPG